MHHKKVSLHFPLHHCSNFYLFKAIMSRLNVQFWPSGWKCGQLRNHDHEKKLGNKNISIKPRTWSFQKSVWFEVKVPVRLSKFESLMSFHDPRATNEKALISSSVLKKVRLNLGDRGGGGTGEALCWLKVFEYFEIFNLATVIHTNIEPTVH